MTRCTAAAIAALCCLPIAAQAQDWDGFYGGLEAGISKPSTGSTTKKKEFVGAFAGYNLDLGFGVAGVEVGYSDPSIAVSSGGTLGNEFKLKGRYGAQIGDGLAYGTLGLLHGKVSTGGSAKGYLYGIGYDHKLGDSLFVGAELSRSNYDKVSGSSKVRSNNLSVRLGFGF